MTRSDAHARLRALLVQRLAGRGEPLFVVGERVLPAAALFAARHSRVVPPRDRSDALVNVVAALWECGAASADEVAGLAPHARGGATAARLVSALDAPNTNEDAEFDADAWLTTTRCAGDEIVRRVLFGARLVLLAPV